jgi:uncharacterized membrane protein
MKSPPRPDAASPLPATVTKAESVVTPTAKKAKAASVTSASSRSRNRAASANPQASSESDQVSQNIGAVLDFYAREEQNISGSQRILERVSDFIGRPLFLGLILLFVLTWTTTTVLLRKAAIVDFDPPPFFWLQGIVSLGAFMVATVVLIKQNRFAKLAEQREHLDLKVTLLTEQKVAKLIELIEELRLDSPNIKNRPDAEAASLKQSMNPEQVLAALDEPLTPGSTPAAAVSSGPVGTVARRRTKANMPDQSAGKTAPARPNEK